VDDVLLISQSRQRDQHATHIVVQPSIGKNVAPSVLHENSRY